MTAFLYLLFAFLISAFATLLIFPWLLYVIMKNDTVASFPKKNKVFSFIASSVIMPCSIIGACVVTMVMLENSISDFAVKLSIQLLGACMVLFYLVSLLDDIFGIKTWVRGMLQFAVAMSFPLCHIYITNLSGLFGIHELSQFQGSVLTVLFVLALQHVMWLMSRSKFTAMIVLVFMLAGFCYMFLHWGLPVYYLGSVAVIGSMSAVIVYVAFHKEMQCKNMYLCSSASSFLGAFVAYLSVKTAMIEEAAVTSAHDGFALTMIMLFTPCADAVQSLLHSMLKERSIVPANVRKRLVYHKLKMHFGSEHMVTIALLLIYISFVSIDVVLLYWGINITWILLLDVFSFFALCTMLPAPQGTGADCPTAKRILFCDNTLWGLVNFRGDIIDYYVRQGFKVYLVAPEKEDRQMVVSVPDGVTFIPVSMGRTSTSPLNDLRYFITLCKIYAKVKPHYCFHYTIKPNIYGSIAAYLNGAECSTAMIAGLGYVFNNRSISALVARFLYKIGLLFTDYLFVLNEGNRDVILRKNLCSEKKVRLLPGGEGINTRKYPLYDNSPASPVIFCFVGRVLYDKGYEEYVAAAEIVKERYPETRFEIWGSLDPQFPNAVPLEKLQFDVGRNVITYKGFTHNSSDIYNRGGVVIVIPSYHEGMNRTLMEACSTGKPIICTRIHGCMEMVAEGGNGYTVPTRDAKALADAMLRYMSLSAEEKLRMSSMSRSLAESRFSIETVIEEYKAIISQKHS